MLSIQTTFDIYPILFDLKCTLLINSTNTQFITSDNPLVKYNQMYIQRKYTPRGFGLGNMGIQLFFPISPNICICVFDHILYDHFPNKEGNIEISKSKQIDEINKLFYLNSYKDLFFNDSIKESYIKKVVNSETHTSSEITKEVNIFGSEDRKLIAYSPRQVNNKINLSFFRINRKFINMPLPPHMAGPMRPYAERFNQEAKKEEKINENTGLK